MAVQLIIVSIGLITGAAFVTKANLHSTLIGMAAYHGTQVAALPAANAGLDRCLPPMGQWRPCRDQIYGPGEGMGAQKAGRRSAQDVYALELPEFDGQV